VWPRVGLVTCTTCKGYFIESQVPTIIGSNNLLLSYRYSLPTLLIITIQSINAMLLLICYRWWLRWRSKDSEEITKKDLITLSHGESPNGIEFKVGHFPYLVYGIQCQVISPFSPIILHHAVWFLWESSLVIDVASFSRQPTMSNLAPSLSLPVFESDGGLCLILTWKNFYQDLLHVFNKVCSMYRSEKSEQSLFREEN